MPVSRLFVAALAVFATVVPGSAVAAAGSTGSVTPNDPMYAEQRDFRLARLNQAWKLSKGASSQVIAIVDGSMRTSHPDLRDRIVSGYSVPSGGFGESDVNPSATEVAGIAAASTNNRKGVAGAAWKARIMPVRVTDSDNRRITDPDLILGIRWAADHRATIINVSLPASGPSAALHDAVKYATRKGALVVAPAGNTVDFTPPDVATYPAAYPEVLAVGATTVEGRLSPGSAWGDWVDLAAPSDQMVTTSASGGYVTLGGSTSWAAGLVSGVAALVRAKYPKLTPAEVAKRLTSTAREAGPQGIDPYFGAGIVDAYAALGGSRATAIAAAAPGAGEPNDTAARATNLSGSAKSTFYVEGDVDWYRFSTTTDGWTTVSVAPTKGTSDSDPDITVYDSDLRQVGVGATVLTDREQLRVRTRPGTYYLQVRQSRTQHTDHKPFTVSVSAATTTPAFHAPLARPGGGRYQQVTVADVTGDSRPDAVVYSESRGDYPGEDNLIVHPQQPDGTLAPAATYPPVGTHRPAVLDVTGDGRTDVVSPKNGKNYVYVQQSDGTLALPVRATNLPGEGQPTAADLDGDGDDDLVLTWHKAVRVLRQEAPGTFRSSALPAEDLGWPDDAVVADLDGNGRADITVEGDTLIATFYQGVDGGWTRQTWRKPWVKTSTLYGLGTGNFDGELAKQFAAVVHREDESGEILIMRPIAGAASLTVTQRIIVPILGGTTGEPSVVIADLTNDGRTDVMVDGPGFVRTYVQQRGGKLALDPSRDLARFTMPYTAGDINGDGLTDLLTGDLGLIVQHAAAGPPVPGDPAWLRDVTPAPGATGVSTTTPVSVTFRRPIDPASVNAATVRLVDQRTGTQVSGTVAYSTDTQTVTVVPSRPLTKNRPYRLWLGKIRDAGGEVHPVSSSGFQTAK
ncbi:MAG TPA: S8 family serine peptidase [Actinoplanes sp.]|nr:S8 family serine peptidase [Actinoplanes sp.]